MEDKIYQRQCVKQGLSLRVLDEMQLERVFKDDELRQVNLTIFVALLYFCY